MLTVLLITAMIGRGQAWDSTGQRFSTVFPENIAFYYPIDPVNAINITAVIADTLVTVTANNKVIYENVVTAGKPVTVSIPPEVEEFRLVQTLRTVTVYSKSNIVVQSLNHRGDSVQTNVVQPMKNLGTFYTIPLLNYTQMINTFFQSMKNISKRYSSFRLFIVNPLNISNSVTIVKKSTNVLYKLNPNAVLQLQTDGTEIAIQSYAQVAVLLTHPCMETAECRCNLAMTQLYPDSLWGSLFIIPSIQNMTNVWLHTTSSNTSSSLTTLPPKFQFLNTSHPVSLKLIGPGFILEVIPLSRFSACFLVPVHSSDGQAVVIAETAHRDSVYIDDYLLSSAEWSRIDDSLYSSASVPLSETCIIWHPFATIAVYVFERSTNIYGGSAIALSANPDPLGCALTPSKFNVVSKLQTWPESHQNCMVGNDELFSPSNEASQLEMANVLNAYSLSEPLWIGLRRSLLTLDWYWQRGSDVHEMTYTQWGSGEPSDPVRGMCASVFPDANMEFQWQSVPCCALLKSVCYTRAEYFPLYFPIDSNSPTNGTFNSDKK